MTAYTNMSNTLRKSRHRGFTLIEVMVVVAIIGILSAIAYPSYVEYVKRGRRAEAQTALMEAAQFMQRFYAANNRYNAPLGSTIDITASDLPVPSSPNLAYDLGFATGSLSPTGFTLVASPKTGGLMDGDKCGSFTLSHTGQRDIAPPDNSTIDAADCWK